MSAFPSIRRSVFLNFLSVNTKNEILKRYLGDKIVGWVRSDYLHVNGFLLVYHVHEFSDGILRDALLKSPSDALPAFKQISDVFAFVADVISFIDGAAHPPRGATISFWGFDINIGNVAVSPGGQIQMLDLEDVQIVEAPFRIDSVPFLTRKHCRLSFLLFLHIITVWRNAQLPVPPQFPDRDFFYLSE